MILRVDYPIELHKNYSLGEEMLESILKGSLDKSAMKEIWGDSIYPKIENALLSSLTLDGATEYNLRRVEKIATPLFDSRERLSQNEKYNLIQKKLTPHEPTLPTQEELKPMFNSNSSKIQKILKIGLDSGLKRKNKKSITTHWNRVAGSLSELVDDDSKNFYTFLGESHDFFEDFFPRLSMKNNQPYLLKNEQNFFFNYFPEQFHEPLRALSNYFGMQIAYGKKHSEREGSSFTNKYFGNYLRNVLKSPNLTENMKNSGEHLMRILDFMGPKEIIDPETLRMLAYNLYNQNLEKYSIEKSPLIYLIKVVDRSDNNLDGDSGHIFRISNLNKTNRIIRHGKNVVIGHKSKYSDIKSTAQTKEIEKYDSEINLLENCLNELEYETVRSAKNMIIEDMFKETLPTEYVGQFAEKINQLISIFYETSP